LYATAVFIDIVF